MLVKRTLLRCFKPSENSSDRSVLWLSSIVSSEGAVRILSQIQSATSVLSTENRFLVDMILKISADCDSQIFSFYEPSPEDGNRCVSDSHSGTNSHRKTPLGTPLVTSAGRCYSPLSVFQTPPPIKEEEPISAAAAELCDSRKVRTSHLNLCSILNLN